MHKALSAAGVAAMAAAMIVPSAASAAAAASSGTFYAVSQDGNLVKVQLDKSGKVTQQTTLTAGSQNGALHPNVALGHHIAGERISFGSSGEKTKAFAVKRSGHGLHYLGKNTNSPWLYAAGRRVAYIKKGRRYTVRESSWTGGKSHVIYTAKAKQIIDSLAVSANGKKAYIGVQLADGGSRVFKVTHRRAHALTPEFATDVILTMALSRDGKTLAYARDAQGGPEKKSLVLKRVASGGLNKAIAYQGFPNHITWSRNGNSITLDDEVANGWAFVAVHSGKVSYDDFNTTGSLKSPTTP